MSTHTIAWVETRERGAFVNDQITQRSSTRDAFTRFPAFAEFKREMGAGEVGNNGGKCVATHGIEVSSGSPCEFLRFHEIRLVNLVESCNGVSAA